MIDALVGKIRDAEKRTKDIETIAGVPRGGLVPAVSLAHRLDATYVDMETHEGGISLIVDDILDSGMTYRRLFGESGSDASAGYFVVLFIKRSQENRYKNVIYAERVDDDVWIVFPWENPLDTEVKKDISLYIKKIHAGS